MNGFIKYNSNNFRSIKLKNDYLGLQRFTIVDQILDVLDHNELSWSMGLSLTDQDQ